MIEKLNIPNDSSEVECALERKINEICDVLNNQTISKAKMGTQGAYSARGTNAIHILNNFGQGEQLPAQNSEWNGDEGICTTCKKSVGVVWHVEDKLWMDVVGKDDYLCIPCFVGLAEKKYSVVTWKLTPIYKISHPDYSLL